MIKKGGIYIIIIVATLAIILVLEYNKPKEVNWFPSFATHHKIPYGTKVATDVMEQMFPNKTQQVIRPPFEFLKQNDTIEGTYFFLNNGIGFDNAELELLLNWVKKGNTIFLAGEQLGTKLMDTLNIKMGRLYGDEGLEHDFYHKLSNPAFKDDNSHKFGKDYSAPYFKEIDTVNASILGIVDNSERVALKNANFIKHTFGKGEIILSVFPKALTNYFILEDENNKNYVAGMLSYIDPNKNIYIDNHYKTGKSYYSSPLYIFLNTKELKWAYYMMLIGAIFYVIFEGKRKQRAIKIITPLKNQTLAFTRTIADMYYEKGRQKEITDHKIAYFMDYVRSKFYLSTQKINDDFYSSIAARSNHTIDEVKNLFQLINRLKEKNQISNQELEKLNTTIEEFKVKAHGK